MGNSIEEKDWSESNESISRFMENAKTTTKAMDRKVDEGPSGEEQCAVVCIQLKMKKSLELWRDGIIQASETCGNISVQTT